MKKAILFDVRTIVGALMLIYGVILLGTLLLLPQGLVGLVAKFENLPSTKPPTKEPAYGAP